MADSPVVTNSPFRLPPPRCTPTAATSRSPCSEPCAQDRANFVGLRRAPRSTRPRLVGRPVRPVLRRRGFSPGDPGLHDPGRRPRRDRSRRPGYKFADEFHPELQFDKPYLLAMANAGPGTNGSQFFITVGQTPHLNRRHTIFGEVIDPESQKVVDAIATTATDGNDRPTEAVVIESITIT